MQTASGDLALLVTGDNKRYLITLQPGVELHTHQGIYTHDKLIGQTWGSEARSGLGHSVLILEPSLTDLITHLRRGTQIIFPKDAAHIVHQLNLRAGSQVIEAGTGSGGLTVALAWAVAPTGVIYTYEARAETYALARRNLERVHLLPYVQMFQAPAEEGFRQRNVDAVMLDMREPWRFLPQVRQSLRPGGFFGSLVPTTNQVSELITALDRQGFCDVIVEELLLRRYKAVPDRLRPEDTMSAHTGYMIFARCIAAEVDVERWQPKERQRYRARKLMEEELAQEAERRTRQEERDGQPARRYPPLPLPG